MHCFRVVCLYGLVSIYACIGHGGKRAYSFLFQDAFEFFSNLTDQLDEILKVGEVNCQSNSVWSLEIVHDKCIFFFISRKQDRNSYLKRRFVACLLIRRFVKSVIIGELQ